MAKVGLVFGGRSTEHRVSVVSARTVAAALVAAGHDCLALGVSDQGHWAPVEIGTEVLASGKPFVDMSPSGTVQQTLSVLLEAQVDVVFPIIHGTYGEDGTLQGLCEMLELPYVGCSVAASSLAMDKALTKRVLSTHAIPVTPWIEVRNTDDVDRAVADLQGLSLPLFVKPSVGGSSVGVKKVDRLAELPEAVRFALKFDDLVLVEQGILGRELECSVLGNEVMEASVLGEIVPGNDFYDYQDKYLEDNAGLVLPAKLDAETTQQVRSLAVQAMKAIGGSGMARVDFLLSDAGEVFLNEINTLPGFTAISMYPKLWQASGVPIAELVDRLVALALERHKHRKQMDGSVRQWLQSLAATEVAT